MEIKQKNPEFFKPNKQILIYRNIYITYSNTVRVKTIHNKLFKTVET